MENGGCANRVRDLFRTLQVPKYASRAAVSHGGATFTMLLFLLLLVSSGLMYFYFQRCLTLEREVSLWKKGVKSREDTTSAKSEKSVLETAKEYGDKIIGVTGTSGAVNPASARPPAPKTDGVLAPVKPPTSTPKPVVAKKEDATVESLHKKPASGTGMPSSSEVPKTAAKSDAKSGAKHTVPVSSVYDLPEPAAQKTVSASAQADADTSDDPAIHVKIPRKTAKASVSSSADDSANPVKTKKQNSDD